MKDPLHDERQRLAQYYSGLRDEELLHLAEEEQHLTEAACDALGDELDRRGLELVPASDPGRRMETRKLVVIRKFRDLPEALLAKGLLDSAGIECYLGDDNIVRMDWFISNFIGGVKLRVAPHDFAVASQILSEPVPQRFEVAGVGEYTQPQCPQCGSSDIAYEALNKPVAYGSAWLGVPIPLYRDKWKCHSCTHEWHDTECGTDT